MKAFCAIVLTAALASATLQEERRDGKAIALFNVVTFPNVECQSTKDTTNKGTCFSSTECSDKGGSAEGNCASGFGVCCIVRVTAETGGDVKVNNTIIENKNYPTAYTTVSKTATYKVTPLSKEICFLRYDFISMDLAITATTGVCSDKFNVAIPSAAGSSPSPVCGLNDGQHMYSDVARVNSATTVTIVTSTTTHSRKWKIKISQIGCDCPVLPDKGCTQFFTENCGTVTSLNYAATTQLLPIADLLVCVRQNSGMCGTIWTQDPNPATGKSSFALYTAITTISSTSIAIVSVNQHTHGTAASGMEPCSYARVEIMGNALCGAHFNPQTKSLAAGALISKDFQMRLTTIGTSIHSSKGYKLNYKQTGCS